MHCSTLWQNFSIFKKLEKFIQRYTRAKFFYLQEARKIYSTLHTAANFSILVEEKLKKFEESSKWASWRSKSQGFVEMGLVEE
jgi:hypothetical protein